MVVLALVYTCLLIKHKSNDVQGTRRRKTLMITSILFAYGVTSWCPFSLIYKEHQLKRRVYIYYLSSINIFSAYVCRTLYGAKRLKEIQRSANYP